MTAGRSPLARSGAYISLCLATSVATFMSTFFVDDPQARYALLASLGVAIHLLFVTR